jgi:hypothetical protein
MATHPQLEWRSWHLPSVIFWKEGLVYEVASLPFSRTNPTSERNRIADKLSEYLRPYALLDTTSSLLSFHAVAMTS